MGGGGAFAPGRSTPSPRRDRRHGHEQQDQQDQQDHPPMTTKSKRQYVVSSTADSVLLNDDHLTAREASDLGLTLLQYAYRVMDAVAIAEQEPSARVVNALAQVLETSATLRRERDEARAELERMRRALGPYRPEGAGDE